MDSVVIILLTNCFSSKQTNKSEEFSEGLCLAKGKVKKMSAFLGEMKCTGGTIVNKTGESASC